MAQWLSADRFAPPCPRVTGSALGSHPCCHCLRPRNVRPVLLRPVLGVAPVAPDSLRFRKDQPAPLAGVRERDRSWLRLSPFSDSDPVPAGALICLRQGRRDLSPHAATCGRCPTELPGCALHMRSNLPRYLRRVLTQRPRQDWHQSAVARPRLEEVLGGVDTGPHSTGASWRQSVGALAGRCRPARHRSCYTRGCCFVAAIGRRCSRYGASASKAHSMSWGP